MADDTAKEEDAAATPEAPVEEGPSTAQAETTTTDQQAPHQTKHKKVKPAPLTETPAQPFPGIPLWIKDWSTSIIIGIFTVSHWRGLWSLFDIWTCGQPQSATGVNGENFCFIGTYQIDKEDAQTRLDSGIFSYWLGAIFTVVGVSMIWAGLWKPQYSKVSAARGVLRFIIVYILGMAACNQWRGIWYITDELIWKDRPLQSNWFTTCVGAGAAFLLCCGGSLLAPPASFLVDGPGLYQPPIAVTIMSSYYSLMLEATQKPPQHNILVLTVDALMSFFGLPILVVWFWRGCWQLQDWYFWDLDAGQQGLLVSLGWSALLGLLCTVATSENIMHYVPDVEKHQQHGIPMLIIGRLRTLISAIGAVAFWRIIWNLWDLGGTTNASCWSSEVVSVFCLTAMGCVSCITAPPSTMGVDVAPNPKCADEPLFAMLPIPWEILFWWGIGRNPRVLPVEHAVSEIEMLEAQPQEEEEEPPKRAGFGPLPSLERVRSWRPGLVREESFYNRLSTNYFECQHPDLEERKCTEYCQTRPGVHQRHRSQFFRNR